MQLKIIIALVLAVGLTGGGWYITHLIGENALLNAAVIEAEIANQQANDALEESLRIRKEQDAQLLKRERQRAAQAAQLGQLKRELKNAKTNITQVELECMESPVPVPVLDLLRQFPKGADRAPSETSLSYGPAVRAGQPAHPHG